MTLKTLKGQGIKINTNTEGEGENMKSIEAVIKKLPPELQQEVEDFVEFLLEKRVKEVKKSRRKPRFDWAGALKELRDQYTSVELQHKISDWRAGKE